jgi:hypothetical protein
MNLIPLVTVKDPITMNLKLFTKQQQRRNKRWLETISYPAGVNHKWPSSESIYDHTNYQTNYHSTGQANVFTQPLQPATQSSNAAEGKGKEMQLQTFCPPLLAWSWRQKELFPMYEQEHNNQL